MVSQCTVLLKQKELASSQKTVTETPKKTHQRKKKSPQRRQAEGSLFPFPAGVWSAAAADKLVHLARLELAKPIPWWCQHQGGLKDVLSDRIPFSSERSFSLQGKRHRTVLFMYWLRWHF